MDGMGIHGTGLYIYLHEWVTFDGKDSTRTNTALETSLPWSPPYSINPRMRNTQKRYHVLRPRASNMFHAEIGGANTEHAYYMGVS